ncbi:hypothetical protein ACLK2B_09115 [Escherichia coli]
MELAKQALKIRAALWSPHGYRVGQGWRQDGQLYIVQARPETVRSRQGGQHPRTLRP